MHGRKERRAAAVNFLTAQTLLEYDLEETSSDSDFVPAENDDQDDFNSEEDDDDEDNDEDESESSDEETPVGSKEDSLTLEMLLAPVPKENPIDTTLVKHLKPICCACLGDRSDDSNEIVECDGCGLTVHEACYGISESGSISSTASSCSTEPWFCDVCRAGLETSPDCELCPNVGGAYKETDCGRWVHLVCALYVPGVAFGDVDALSSVTLFEMQYNKWGAKACLLCDDSRFARTGVCIGCDAGMCKTYFHVTCGQSAGFLAEAHNDEIDPFYAHCKLHSDKTQVKNRKRNYQTWRLQSQQRTLEKQLKKAEGGPAQERIERKLKKHKTKYTSCKTAKADPWVPTQKMPRPLHTSAGLVKRLMRKTELMGINAEALEIQEAQIAALSEVRKKWHIPPAFSVEFVGYYLDRTSRMEEIKRSLQNQKDLNVTLTRQQEVLRTNFEDIVRQNDVENNRYTSLCQEIERLHAKIQELCPNKPLLTLDNVLNNSPANQTSLPAVKSPRRMAVPTAAALKMGVGFPLALNDINGRGAGPEGRVLSTQSTESRASSSQDQLVHDCGICKGCQDQHLLAKCDTCQLYYHLGCLNPPLSRHPKKSKLYGWQCSECDKSDDSSPEIFPEKQPRRSRTRFSKDGSKVPVDSAPQSPVKAPLYNGNASHDDIKPVSPLDGALETKVSKKPAKKVGPGGKRKRSHSEVKTEVKKENHVSPIKSPPRSPVVPKMADPEPIKAASPTKSVSNHVHEKPPKKVKKDATEDTVIVNGNGNGEVETPRTKSKKKHKDKDKEKVKDKRPKSETCNSDSLTPESGEKKVKRKRKRKEKEQAKEDPQVSVPLTPDPPQRIKIKFKAIPQPDGAGPGAAPVIFYVNTNDITDHYEGPQPVPNHQTSPLNLKKKVKTSPSAALTSPKRANLNKSEEAKAEASPTLHVNNKTSTPVAAALNKSGALETYTDPCCMCAKLGSSKDAVKCDECSKIYHFLCLEPPLKKTPKKRGYSWHCADCDPSDLESKRK